MKSLTRALALLALLALCSAQLIRPVHADTVVFKNGEALEGKIVKKDDKGVELEVEYGTMLVPVEKILRIEEDTPEKIKAREDKLAADKALAEQMKAEGKIQYKGKWVTEEEKKADETKLADARKKKAEERAAKLKKEQELAAKAKEEEAKAIAAQALADAQAAQAQNNNRNRRNGYNNNSNGSNPYNGYDANGNSYNSGGGYNNNNNYGNYGNNSSINNAVNALRNYGR